jgi:hypothetical protein
MPRRSNRSSRALQVANIRAAPLSIIGRVFSFQVNSGEVESRPVQDEMITLAAKVTACEIGKSTVKITCTLETVSGQKVRYISFDSSGWTLHLEAPKFFARINGIEFAKR